MKTILFSAAVGGLSLAGLSFGAAHAQSYPGYHGYQAPKPNPYATPAYPQPPKAPEPPSFAEQPGFKPFKGQHVYSDRGGLDPYQKPRKPRGGFSTYGH